MQARGRRAAREWTGSRGSRVAVILWAALAPAFAPGEEAREAILSAPRRFAFDIPAQPLAGALETFSAVTGIETLYDSSIAHERRSTPLRGVYTTVDGLRLLLIGTALSARSIARDAVTIESARPAAVAGAASPPPDKSTHRLYFGLIQTALERAFCKDDPARPGAYRMVVTFAIDADGRIRQPRVVGSTGGDDRDRMILRRLEGVSLSSAPPADLPQPVMMAILPRSSGTLLACEPSR